MSSDRSPPKAKSNAWIVFLVLGIVFIVFGLPLLLVACILLLPVLGAGAFFFAARNAEDAPAPKMAQAPVMEQPLIKQDAKKFIADNLGTNNYPGALGPAGSVWAKIDPKTSKQTFKKSNQAGNIFGDQNFTETPPDGGVLIGFFAAEDDGQLVCFVQPIFLTAKGEKVGNAYGAVQNRPMKCLKAKPGYAVGGVHLRTGATLDQIQVQFSKVTGERLDGTDFYRSEKVGGEGGGPSEASGPGLPVGIHGSKQADGPLKSLGRAP